MFLVKSSDINGSEYSNKVFNFLYKTQGSNLGEAKGGGAPLNKNFAPLKCTACPAKLPFSLRQFQDGGFCFWKPTEN